ncbi:putative RNA-directed DNA polymerase from transposon X-element [Trichonephila clavata]|uniref:Putative RNA-directed DNA polymerase from transposon X-element n=1 Tax=Trichonephila clavata TaxID=2740835 RepID=A0A8X6M644_TRICU|nr:putative RNA-directed DNA polymerase from transposon X-element [Trichonephila clavata]
MNGVSPPPSPSDRQEMEATSESSDDSRRSPSPAAPQIPNVNEMTQAFNRIDNSYACLQFCSSIECKLQELPYCKFDTPSTQNKIGLELYALLSEARPRYIELKKAELQFEQETLKGIYQQWGLGEDQETGFTVVNRKQKHSNSPSKLPIGKKPRTENQANRFDNLDIEEPPAALQDDDTTIADFHNDPTIRTSTPFQHRPPPPITIDNIEKTAQLLKRLQDLTGEKLVGRTIGKSLRVYPQTPIAYRKIRNLIEVENLESYTHQLAEEKDLKVVIRGMPVDMPVQEIVADLHSLGITVTECKPMNNRKTGLPMPLFLLTLPKTDDNKNIYNISEICSMKVKPESLNRKHGPAQCFRCQGFFHSSRFCTRNPKCVKWGKPHLTRDCVKTINEDPTCCHCQGKHPANFLGCPNNPLNRVPPPPKVNAWDERLKKKKELQEAARQRALLASQAPSRTVTHPIQKPKPIETIGTAAPIGPTATIGPTAPTGPTAPIRTITPASNPPNEIFNTLSQLKDPEVMEMMDVLTQFVKISKSHKSRAEKHDPDIIALQETGLQPCHSLNIPNYTTHRKDRLTHRGGGTAILVKNSIGHHSLNIHTHSIENTTIDIEGENVITICSVYRPPTSPRGTLTSDLLRIFRNRNHCLIIGDFNAKHRSWNPLSVSKPAGTELFKFAVNCGFLITAPTEATCLTSRTGPGSIIDLGISCGLQDLHATTLIELSSDHNPVVFALQPDFPYSYAHNCLTLTNWNHFQDILSITVPGNPRIENPDAIDRAVTNLTNHIQSAMKQSSRFKFINHQVTYIPPHIRLKIKEKNRLRENVGRAPSTHKSK